MVIRPLVVSSHFDIGDSVRGVDHQVEDHLIELDRQATHRGQVRVELRDGIGDVLPLVTRHRKRALNRVIEIDGLHLARTPDEKTPSWRCTMVATRSTPSPDC